MSKSKNRSKPIPAAQDKSQPASTPSPRTRPPAWRSRIGLIIAFFAISIGGAYLVTSQTFSWGGNVKSYGFKEIARYPHDSQAFTEGLVFYNGKLYESTGVEGQSSIRHTDLETREVVIHEMDPHLFGEGITLWSDRLIQLTYNSEIALCYDLDLKPLDKKFEYEGQGWGLTHDGQFLIMSNGTSQLQFRNPETFELDHRITVSIGGRNIGRLNELEYVNGKIYANVWHEDYILEIDPTSGTVTGRIDLGGLLPYSKRPNHQEAVLNGIAYNNETKRFIVTGKYWPYFFEIELIPRDGN